MKTCREKRDSFHAAKDKYSRDKSREIAEKLTSLSKNDTKEFWNTLSNFSGRKKENADIPIETFYKYLKNLNEEMQDENDEDDILFWMTYENPVYDMILNGSITKWNDRCNTK